MDVCIEEDVFPTDHDEDDPSKDEPNSEKEFYRLIRSRVSRPPRHYVLQMGNLKSLDEKLPPPPPPPPPKWPAAVKTVSAKYKSAKNSFHKALP